MRARHLEEYDTKTERFVPADGQSDINRIERQQDFIRRLMSIAVRESLGDPFTANTVADNIVKYFSVVALTGKEYSELSLKLGQNNVVGGKAYDVLHLRCAEKCGADRIYTFNVRDFAQPQPFQNFAAL